MAKGTKRKVPGVGIDFKRARHKVGRKVPKADNATDTTFKSRAINLPGQSIGEQKQGEAVTRRNLTLQELLGQCSHYSERVRKEALQGLAELVRSHPGELRRQAASVLEALAERLADPQPPVRRALREMLAGAVLPALGAAALPPFLPLLMTHLCSAFTHLSQGVRADALLVLEVLVRAAPRELAAGHLGPALQHFAGLLAPAQRGQSIKARSLPSLLQVILGLNSFLDRVSDATSASTVAPSNKAVQSRVEPGHGPQEQPQRRLQGRLVWQGLAQPPETPSQLLDGLAGSFGLAGPKASSPGAAEPAGAPARLLLARLLECWAECGPGQLREGAELPALQALAATLKCLLRLLPLLGPAGVDVGVAQSILAAVGPYVPEGATSAASAANRQSLAELNHAAAQLLSRLFATCPNLGFGPDGQEQAWLARLLDLYTELLLQRERKPASEQAAAVGQSGAGDIGGVLEGVQRVLPLLPPHRRAGLLQALTQLSAAARAKSPTKAACLAFQLAVLSDPRTGPALLHHEPSTVAEWLSGLPKLLYELGRAAPATSHAALRLLHHVARAAAPGGPLAAAVDALQAGMCPFYIVALPAGGAGAAGSGRGGGGGKWTVVPGPLSKLPRGSQELAVDLTYFYPALAPATLRTLALLALARDAYPPALGVRAIEIAAARLKPQPGMNHEAAAAPELREFVLGLVAGRAAQVPAFGTDWPRDEAVVEAACLALQGTCPDVASLRAAEQGLLERCCGAAEGLRGCYGCLRAAATLAACAAAMPQAAADPAVLDGGQADSAEPSNVASSGESQPDELPGVERDIGDFTGPSTLVEDQATAARPAQAGIDEGHTAERAQEPSGISLSEPLLAALPGVALRYARLVCGPATAGSGGASEQGPGAGAGPGLQPVLQLLRAAPQLLPGLLEHFAGTCKDAAEGGSPEAREELCRVGPALLRLLLEASELLAALLQLEAPLHSAMAACRAVAAAAGEATAAGAACLAELKALQAKLNHILGRDMAS